MIIYQQLHFTNDWKIGLTIGIVLLLLITFGIAMATRKKKQMPKISTFESQKWGLLGFTVILFAAVIVILWITDIEVWTWLLTVLLPLFLCAATIGCSLYYVEFLENGIIWRSYFGITRKYNYNDICHARYYTSNKGVDIMEITLTNKKQIVIDYSFVISRILKNQGIVIYDEM